MLGTLTIDLVAKTATMQRDLGVAARAAEKTANQIATAMGVVTSAMSGLAAGFGATGLIAIVRRVTDGVDALNDLKDATGASIENISALEDVAARTGTSFDAVGASLVKFNQVLGDAKPGTDAARALELLGLSVRDLKAQDPAEALRQTAVALARFADDGDKARIVQDLFGRSVREVAPFLADLAKQGELVATVTTQQAEAAEKFNQQIAQMTKNAADLGRVLVGDLVVGINAAAKAYRESGLLSAAGVLFGGTDEYRLNRDLFQAVGQKLEIERELQELRRRGFNDDSRGMQVQLANLRRVEEEIARIQALRNNPNSGASPIDQRAAARILRQGAGGLPSIGSVGGGKASAAEAPRKVEIEDTRRAVESYIHSLERQLEREQELSQVEQTRLELARKGNVSLEAAGRAISAAQQLDVEQATKRQREEHIKYFEDLDRAIEAANESTDRYLQAMIDATPSAQLERARNDQLLLAEALRAGKISEAQYLEAAAARAGIVQRDLEKTKTLADELGLTFTSAFEDAVVGGKKLSDVLRGLQQDLLRVVLRKTVTEPLGGWVSTQVGDLIKGLIPSFDGGGFTGSGPRTGGLDGQGGFLSVVHPQESIVDHSRGPMGGAPTTVIINQTVGDLVTGEVLRKSNRDLIRHVQGAIYSSVTRGGLLAI